MSELSARFLCGALSLAAWLMLVAPAQADIREYSLPSFERIYLHGSAQVHLQQRREGDAPVLVKGVQTLLDKLSMESVDGVLYIDTGDFNDANAADLVIQLPVAELKEVVSQGGSVVIAEGLSLAELTLEGHGLGRFELHHLRLDDLTVIGRGATQFNLSGETENQVVELAGVGRYQAAHLLSRNSQVLVSGAGDVDVWVEDILDVSILGSARLRYAGTPWVMQKILGAGDIARHRVADYE